jgi:putative oxidoreductase
MSTLRQVQLWSATHHPKWLVIVRIALGLLLFAKGINFIRDSNLLDRLIWGNGAQAENHANWLPILITWANLLGGFFLMVGLMTRLAAFLQLPIMIGAIIFINAQKGGFAAESELALAILVLLLLLLFLIEGGGPLSLDNYFYKNSGRRSQGTNLPG